MRVCETIPTRQSIVEWTSAEGDWLLEFMVNFVDARIHHGSVEEAVEIVEDELLRQLRRI